MCGEERQHEDQLIEKQCLSFLLLVLS